MKCKITLSLVTFGFIFVKAQTVTPTVISSQGNYDSQPQGNNSWTIGEPISETFTSANNAATNGFQQPESLNLVTYIKGNNKGLSVLAYPNPVINELKVDFNGIDNGDYSLVLNDALGKVIYQTTVSVNSSSNKVVSLNFLNLAGGQYLLSFSNQDQSILKTFKIVKTN